MRTRRFSKAKTAHRVFLVICEGETEEAYVRMLIRHYRLPIVVRTRVSGNAVCRRLVDQYVKELGLDDDDTCRIFYIYDNDVACVADRVRGLPGMAILSSPCLEIWYLLHSADCRKEHTPDSLIRTLTASHPVWRPYAKGALSRVQTVHLIENMKVAGERGRRLEWPKNPSSNMYEFIAALEAVKC